MHLVENYEFTAVAIKGLPEAHIIESDSIDQLLLVPGRFLMGGRRQQVAFTSTMTWLRALKDKGILPAASDLCTLSILAEGIGSNLPLAVSEVLYPDHCCGDNWLGISRFALSRAENDSYVPFDAMVTYMRLHSPAPVWCVLDTVATGATMLNGLRVALANAPKPDKILMAAPAGSVIGVKKIAEFCRQEGIELHVTFWGAAFGLGEDGTALPWCHPKTILSGTAKSRKNLDIARKLFNNLPEFCAVGDCSANFFDIQDATKILKAEEDRLNWHLLGPQPCKTNNFLVKQILFNLTFGQADILMFLKQSFIKYLSRP